MYAYIFIIGKKSNVILLSINPHWQKYNYYQKLFKRLSNKINVYFHFFFLVMYIILVGCSC